MESETELSAVRLRRALDWAIRGRRWLPGVLDQGALLRLATAVERRSLTAEHYHALTLFAEVMWRVHSLAEAPPLCFADCLRAMRALAERPLDVWRFEPELSPENLRRIGYREELAGIDRQAELHRAGWLEHCRRSRELVISAVERARPRSVLVLGAARVNDIPLLELALRVPRLILADVDEPALNAVGEAPALSPELRARIEIRALDLTGVAGQFAGRIAEIFALSREPAVAAERFAQLCAGYALSSPPRWLEEPVDLVISQMVLSQLSAMLERHARTAFESRFPRSDLAAERVLRGASARFAHLLQQDHVDALARHGRHVLLTSDVLEQPTARRLDGRTQRLGEPRRLIGSYRLLERVGTNAHVVQHADWLWQRALPRTSSEQGSVVEVQAVFYQNQKYRSLVAPQLSGVRLETSVPSSTIVGRTTLTAASGPSANVTWSECQARRSRYTSASASTLCDAGVKSSRAEARKLPTATPAPLSIDSGRGRSA